MTKNDTNIEIALHEPYKTKEARFDGYYTKTTHFLLAGLGINPNSNIFRNHFLNAYIDDAFIEHRVKNPVFLLLKAKEFDEGWTKLDLILKSLARFVFEYDAGTDRGSFLVMFVFEFPSVYSPDYFRFLSGEYSKFSTGYKRLFKKEIMNDRGIIVENTIYGVIYKTDNLKARIESELGQDIELGGEFWEKMSPKREVFRYNN